MYRFIFLLLSSFLLSKELPQGLTQWELDNMHIIDEMRFRTEPPPPPVRNVAEYEPMQGALIRYPFGISTSLIREMAEDVIIYCLVSTWSQNSAYNSMNNAGVNMDNVEFIVGSTDSYWTRDYGPWWVVDGNGDYAIVDFTYNRPRPNDNQAPSKVSQHLNVPYYSADIVATGGNYMTDGFGIAAAAHIAYTENDECNTNNQSSIPLPPCAYVDNIMYDYYGIDTFHVVADPNDEYIDHIDCWGKFLSPTKILIRSVPTSHDQYSMIEQVAGYFESANNSDGNPWEVFRVYTPSDQPYTNSLILNNKVFVPIMNSSWDDDALEVYQAALPDHEILGFTGSWESTDALHCRVKGIPDISYMQFESGDVNLDGNLNIQDIVLVINYILNTSDFDSTQLSLADLNVDGAINIQDVILLINLVLEN
jgi:agmatine deiminase